MPLIDGREFTADDRVGSDPVVIVSQSVAQRMFPERVRVEPPLLVDRAAASANLSAAASWAWSADVDDENVVRGQALTIYHPVAQLNVAGRMFVHAAGDGDPYALVRPVTRVIREMSSNQPVERVATLEDVRAEVLSPERVNAFVLTGFAGIALLIAAVGVAGVLAFSVSARTREFGVRLAMGSTPRHLLMRILSEGAVIVIDRHWRGRGGRLRVRGAGAELLRERPHAGRAAAGGGWRRARERGDRGIADAGRAPRAWMSCRRCGRNRGI